MREYMTLGATPCEEDCAQVGSPDYRERALRECRAYKAQLLRMHGTPPEGAELRIKAFAHDFGTYHEVVIAFEDTSEVAIEYAYKVEAGLPGNWDDEAMRELGLCGLR